MRGIDFGGFHFLSLGLSEFGKLVVSVAGVSRLVFGVNGLTWGKVLTLLIDFDVASWMVRDGCFW